MYRLQYIIYNNQLCTPYIYIIYILSCTLCTLYTPSVQKLFFKCYSIVTFHSCIVYEWVTIIDECIEEEKKVKVTIVVITIFIIVVFFIFHFTLESKINQR